MFERFTERARQAVVLAQDEARRLRHNYIGTEHILLGLLAEKEGLAARVLESLGLGVDELRAEVGRIIGLGDEVATGQIPFTPRAKKTLERALREALSLKHKYIGTEHLLLALARVDEGVAAQILSDRGLDRERVRGEVLRMVGAGAPADAPPAEATPPEPFKLESPPLAREFLDALEQLRAEKEAAIEAQDFDQAARLRDRERRMTAAARELVRVWREDQRGG